jgi:hypothetical protein
VRARATTLARLPATRRMKQQVRRRGDGWGSRGDAAVARAGVGTGAERRLERRPWKLGARLTTPSSRLRRSLDLGFRSRERSCNGVV